MCSKLIYIFIGTADYTQNPCPVGHYCMEGVTEAAPCPMGSYRTATGGRSIKDCESCPAGYYCPRNGSAERIPCTNGTYCPEGSTSPRPCQAGYYCPDAAKKITCPPGYFCPYAATDNPKRCLKGHYCPGSNNCSLDEAGTIDPKLCWEGRSLFQSFTVKFSFLECFSLLFY